MSPDTARRQRPDPNQEAWALLHDFGLVPEDLLAAVGVNRADEAQPE